MWLDQDLRRRRPVWHALSTLYLDTEIDGSDPHVARVLAESDYPLPVLRRILFEEVHPVLRANLLAPAGVWDGFDRDWLEARILQRLARPRWRRAPAWPFAGAARAYWTRLAPLVAAARAGATA